MRARLERLWDRLRTSLWFVPGGMTVVTVVLAITTIAIDRSFEPEAYGYLGWTYSGGPEGARALLATVAGSMATIAGVTFSITIVALTMASAQYGPRLLRNFMRDTSNQFVLGTFVATFVYCLMVLRTIRGPEQSVFVPQVSVTLGLILAVFSLGVLIYFIHHVSSSIQADSIIAAVGAECDAVIEKLYPEAQRVDTPEPFHEELPIERIKQEGTPLIAPTSGYIQAISRSETMSLATKHDLILWIRYRPGDFVIRGTVLMKLWPAERVSDEVREDAKGCVVTGANRTPIQDVEFAINQLVEVAARALSPGVNDPFTAVACVDRLGAILAKLAQRVFPPPYRMDDEGRLRVIEDCVTFDGVLDAAFNQIRQYGRSDVAVLIRLLDTIAALGDFAHRPSDQKSLLKHAEMVHAASESIPEARDRQDLDERYRLVRRVLDK